MPKAPRTFAVLRSALAWLAIGLATNVLIAWALATINTPELLHEEEVVVTLTRWPMPAPAGWPKYRQDPQDEAKYGADVEWVLWGASRVGAQSDDSAGGYTMNTRTAGLPFRCLVEGWCSEYTLKTGAMKQTHRYALGWLPLCPIWPGFALNTIFYAAIAWGLWQVPWVIRRRSRRRKGRCVRCGYDLGGLAVRGAAGTVCPECGTGAAPAA